MNESSSKPGLKLLQGGGRSKACAPTVSEITFVVVVNGNRRVSTFLHQDKIADLLGADSETLGSWLRALTESK